MRVVRRNPRQPATAPFTISGGRSAPPPAPPGADRRGDQAFGPAKPALGAHHLWVSSVVNINDVLDGHVSLDIACMTAST